MCIAIPAKIIAIDGQKAWVAVSSAKTEVFLSFSGAKLGDWVLVHAGIALAAIEEEQALETLQLLTQLSAPPAGK